MLRVMTKSISEFLRDESGPTAVEYAIMIGLLISVCLLAIATLGEITNESFTGSSRKINNATAS